MDGNRRAYPRIYYEMLTINIFTFLGMNLVGSFLPILAKDLDPTESLIGVVVSAWFLPRIFIELPSGFLSDRIGRPRLYVLGLFLGVIGTILCAIAPSIHILILGRAIWGFGMAFYFLNNTALLFDLFQLTERGRAIGTFQGISNLGGLIAGPIGGFLAGFLGYYSVFIASFILACSTVIVALTSTKLNAIREKRDSQLSQRSITVALLSLPRWPIFVVCTINLIRMMVMNGVMSTVFQLHLHDNLGFNLGLSGIVVGLRTVGFSVSTFLSGYLSLKVSRKTIIIFGLALEALGLFSYTLVQSFPLVLLIGFVSTLGGGFTWNALTVLLSNLVQSESRGIALGLYRTFMDIGGTLGPIVMMSIAIPFGLQVPFTVGAALLFVMVALTFTLKLNR
ncbi:MAG: MFS transporter [Candidatus Bathyarchaeota archaeon]|nr:MAG: MFS transporter [Candidatus Bathyarchaeota archaeon]